MPAYGRRLQAIGRIVAVDQAQARNPAKGAQCLRHGLGGDSKAVLRLRGGGGCIGRLNQQRYAGCQYQGKTEAVFSSQ
ncbi:hypothetical protein GCM10017655_05840 [Pseudomonas turukhanskensis]|uniref:Uncharacterized protein n=1 Tax=Pseudomonas turukhanskensis TaxID=1806536 RepID=A0A9W6NE94_9PSED|nr:hypothetical protein GCM10017655_05840 [Pseudomonas turukhanskensis]